MSAYLLVAQSDGDMSSSGVGARGLDSTSGMRARRLALAGLKRGTPEATHRQDREGSRIVRSPVNHAGRADKPGMGKGM